MSRLHSFKSTTFFSPTYCQYCSKLLWGLVQQGVQCIECNYVAHHYCQKYVPAECQTTSHPISKTPAEKSLLNNLQQQAYSESRFSTFTTTSSNKNHTVSISNALKELQEIIISAALDVSSNPSIASSSSRQYSCEYLSSQPPLHPHTTAKNFTRFVTRCTIVFNLRDAIILLVCWDKPLNSWISILVYTLLCLYPKLLLLVPQCILLYLILFKSPQQEQQRNTSAQNSINSKDISSDVTNTQDSSIMNNQNNNPNKNKTTTNQQQQTQIPSPSPKTTANTTFTFLSLITNSNNNTTTPAYKNNLKNIQNMMGEFALVHDQLVQFYNEYYNLLGQEVCIQIVLLWIVFTTIILWFIPLRWIFLSSGWFTFAIHTPFVKAFSARLIKTKKHLLLLDVIQDWMIIPLQAWYNTNIELSEQSTHSSAKCLTVSIYENQQRKLKNENNETIESFIKDEIIPWSNLYGIPQPSPNQKRNAPKGYRWKGEDWRIDTTGPWVDDDLQLAVRPKIEKNEQDEGWVYMDENWNNLRSESYQQSTTRRRRWIRDCELK